MDTSILEELGLSNAEAKIYLALLGLGSSKTGKIIDTTKMQSSTVYHVLGSLVEKGLVSNILQGKTKWFQAEKPESFLFFLDEKKRKFEEALPKLKEQEALANTKQTARVYQGIKGLQAAFNDILTSLKRGELYYFFSAPKPKLYEQQVIRFFRSYHLKRSEKGIKVKGLSLKDSKHIIKQIFKDIPHTKVQYIKDFAPSGLVIYKDKVITLDWENVPTAFVIQSKAVARSYRKFFEEKWKTAKP